MVFSKMKIDVSAQTHIGLRRSVNEDCYFFDEDAGVYLVADGMGGHFGGALASRAAASVFETEYKQQLADSECSEEIDMISGAVKQTVKSANDRIYELNREHGFNDGHGMGTAIAGLCFNDSADKIVVFHIGDSRVYRYRRGVLERLTRDHSLYQQWIDDGSKGEPPGKNIILRVIGPYPEAEVDINTFSCIDGDIYLMCTDGLTDLVSDEDIKRVLQDRGYPALDNQCQELITEANRNGGLDNITALMVNLK